MTSVRTHPVITKKYKETHNKPDIILYTRKHNSRSHRQEQDREHEYPLKEDDTFDKIQYWNRKIWCLEIQNVRFWFLFSYFTLWNDVSCLDFVFSIYFYCDLQPYWCILASIHLCLGLVQFSLKILINKEVWTDLVCRNENKFKKLP